MILVNGESLSWREGFSVQDLLDEKDAPSTMIVVWLDGRPVDPKAFSSTLIRDDSQILLLHLISGG